MTVVNSRSEPIELELVTKETRPILENLLQLYIHDLSQFRFSRPDGAGRFNHDDRYAVFFTDPDRGAYLFRDASGPVGFGLVRGISERRRLMAGFFVVRGVRQTTTGRSRRGAQEMLRRHPGTWEIPFQEEECRCRPVLGAKWPPPRSAMNGPRIDDRCRTNRTFRTTSGSPWTQARFPRTHPVRRRCLGGR